MLALGGGDESLVSTLWIRGLVDGERVITRLGEGVDLRAPAISAVGPPRDRLAFLRRGSIEVGKGRSLELLLAKIGLDPLGSHHDTELVLLRRVNLLLRLTLEKGWLRWEGWEVIEGSKSGMASIGIGELD